MASIMNDLVYNINVYTSHNNSYAERHCENEYSFSILTTLESGENTPVSLLAPSLGKAVQRDSFILKWQAGGRQLLSELVITL